MYEPTPRNLKSTKSRLDGFADDQKRVTVSRTPLFSVQSHFLVAPDRLERITRRVVAPYAQIERKALKEERKEGTYLDINRFTVFLEDRVDLDSLLYETSSVLKTVSNSSGVFVYIVNKVKNEIVLMPGTVAGFENNPSHEVNIPIEEGKVLAAHVASTKEYLLLDDVQRDRRFSEGLKWLEAKSALCMPVVKPDGECYAVLELFRTFAEPYNTNVVYSVISVACWAGAAVHQAQARVTLQKTAHLNSELRSLLQNYFCDLASLDTMLTDMLAVIKSIIGAMRSTFYIVDRFSIGTEIQADMWDDGWTKETSSMPRKRNKVNLSEEQTPAGLVARTGVALNLSDSYKDARFKREIDPTTGTVVRSVLASPILDKRGVIGVVQLTNKKSAQAFNAEDEEVFKVFVSYSSLIILFHNKQQKKIYHENLNQVLSYLLRLNMMPCRHDFHELMESSALILPPSNFRNYNYHISEGNKEDIPGLVCYMFVEIFADRKFERGHLADFVLTILRSYRDNPYHNADHAFCFTHTMYLILTSNLERFDTVEILALMLSGLCHDVDHPGFNNNFLMLTGHPLAQMYKTSILEHHHYFLARKLIEDKLILSKLAEEERDRILDEMKFNILCTDLAVYFQLRAKLMPLVADQTFDWSNNSHRKMVKGILMTTSDLSGCCKPFGIAKSIAESVYDEFYAQGDIERSMGYSPLSMMDRSRNLNQPAEQVQFLSVVVLPCLMLVQSILPNTAKLVDNCRKTQDSWREEIEIRGLRLWKQESSIIPSRSKFSIRSQRIKS